MSISPEKRRSKPRNTRSGGRSARVQLRTTPGEMPNPCPPGQRGGAYKPLDDAGLKKITDTAFQLLAELGIGDVPKRFQDLALSKGAYLNDKGRLCYSSAMVEDVIDGAARQFVLHGRDPKHDLEIGGDRVFFGTGGAAVQTLDIDRASIGLRPCVIFMISPA